MIIWCSGIFFTSDVSCVVVVHVVYHNLNAFARRLFAPRGTAFISTQVLQTAHVIVIEISLLLAIRTHVHCWMLGPFQLAIVDSKSLFAASIGVPWEGSRVRPATSTLVVWIGLDWFTFTRWRDHTCSVQQINLALLTWPMTWPMQIRH